MNINDLDKEIDKAFSIFEDKLDLSNFSLWIEPKPLKVWDEVEDDDVVVDEQQEEYKELDFSSWLYFVRVLQSIYIYIYIIKRL